MLFWLWRPLELWHPPDWQRSIQGGVVADDERRKYIAPSNQRSTGLALIEQFYVVQATAAALAHEDSTLGFKGFPPQVCQASLRSLVCFV